MGYIIGFIIVFFITAFVGLSVTKTKKNKQIAAAVAFVLAAGSMIALFLSNRSPSANYSVQVRTFRQLPGQYVRVYLNITNTGKIAGTPVCTATVQPTNSEGDSLGNGGVDGGAMKGKISAGATVYSHIDVLVAGNDAALVTSKSMISASCI